MMQPGRLDRAFITVSGPDARPYLNSLLTQDVTSLISGHDPSSFVEALRTPDAVTVLFGALLSPQGKVISDMLIWPQLNGITLEVSTLRAADLFGRLTMYKLRAQVEIHDMTPALMATWSPSEFQNSARDPRLSALGWRKLAARDHAEPLDAAYDALRISLGVPDLARDAAADEVFALEALLEELNGVDFAKGCFVGQENVSRMKRRATTRRKFCPIVFEGQAPPFGTPVLASDVEIGSVRSGAPGKSMALLRLDRALAAPDALSAGGRPVRLDAPAWLILPRRDNL